MLKKSILNLIILFSLTIFTGCFNDDANDMLASKEHVLTSLEGKQIVIKQDGEGFYIHGQKDKLVIFDIFATWCPPCRATATHLTSLQKKYKDDLVIIGITIEDNIANEKLQEFAKENNAKYILVNSSTNRTLADAIVMELGLGERYPIPTMAMYKDGKLINHFVGMTQEEFIESDIKKALGK